MKILAVDLVWSGKSGLALWNDREPDPVSSYGEFEVKSPGDESFETILIVSSGIVDNLLSKFRQLKPDIAIAEQSDWFQNLDPRKRNWKSTYARERQTQRRLGWAEMAFVTACKLAGIDGRFIGATEAKREFGATGKYQKKLAAELFSQEYGRFRMVNEPPELKELQRKLDHEAFLKKKERVEDKWLQEGPFLYDSLLGKYVSSHISDAFILASVMEKRLRQEMLIAQSEMEPQLQT